MKKLIALGIVSALALSVLAGCSAQSEGPKPSGGVNHKPVINFEGVVSQVEDGVVTLEDGTVVLITADTVFGGDPDSGTPVNRDIQAGSFIQGYTEDGAGSGQLTAQRIWTNQPQSGGKLRINFEGRVTQVEAGSVTLDSGKTVLVGDQTIIEGFDGSAAEIAVGDYIQGYATDPDSSQLEALRILVTIL